MSARAFRYLTIGLLFALILAPLTAPNALNAEDASKTRYLAFQVFSGAPSPNQAIGGTGAQPLSVPSSKASVKQLVQEIVGQIGTTGDRQNKLAFIIGPLAFDQTDAQLQQMIHDAFDIALELNVAVGFHIDDSMFWARRSDLWRDPQNVEWLDWDGTPNSGRRIDWSAQPTKLAPQMCFNSPAIQAEVSRLATQVIGGAIEKGIRDLEAQGKPELFAGVIVGWETQIGQDFDTGDYLGYCALTNRGFSRDNPPQDLDNEREHALQAFIGSWATGIKQAGIDPAKIYSHTAVLAQINFDQMNNPGMTYSQENHFAPPEVSFGANYQPGFSTYPQRGLMEQLYEEFQNHGNPSWASAEGSTVNPAVLESVIDTETYLAWMFNHGAALVNIFGWGVGTQGENPFWQAADKPDAINAYRKFLDNQPLVEAATDMTASLSGSLPDKIHQIQASLPAWIQAHPDQQTTVEPLLRQLDQAVKNGNLQDAQAVADAILSLIGQ
ncbi:MAG: hypothetical protein ABI700_19390 [Chloroflexota bacterium]